MPSGSDGSIVLSVNIDEEDLGNQISKLKNQLKKSFSSIDGVADRFSNVAQELTKFSQILERINSETHEQIIASEEIKQLKAKTSQEQSKSLQEEEKATQEITNSKIAQEELEQAKTNTVKKTNELLISEQRVEQAVNNTAISHEKLGQSVNKTAISNEQVTQAINRSIISNETMASIDGALAESKEKQVRLEERRSEVISGVSDKYSDIVDEINEAYENSDELTKSAEELKQAINETAISYEKVEQSVIDTAMYQERLRQAINNTAVSEENVEIAKSKVRQEQQKEIINEEKIRQAKEKSRQEQEKTTREILKTKKAQDSVNDATKKVTASLKKMASALGSALGLVVSVTAILNFLSESSKLASQTEAHLQRLGSLYDENAQGVYDWANANAHALGMSTAEAYKAAADFGNLFTTFADSQQSAELSIDMMKATAVVASQTGRTYEETFEKMQSGIYGNTRAIDDLGISVRQSSLMQTQAWKDVSKNGTKSWNDLTDAELQQLRTLGIIEQAQLKYGNTVVQSSELVRSKFNAAWKDFEATWGQVVNVVLIPLLDTLTTVINAITSGLKAVANFLGVSKENEIINSNNAKNTSKTLQNQKDLTKATKKTNEELERSLMGFDKINKLSDDTSDNSSSGSYDTETPLGTTVGGGTESDYLYEMSGTVQAVLGAIMIVAGEALLAIGLILLVTGNIPWGIGAIIGGLALIGVGAVALGKAFNKEEAISILGLIGAVGGIVLITLGVVLLALGNIPWGVAAIIAGIALEGVVLYKLGDKLNSDIVSKLIQDIAAVAAGGLAALGVIFLAFGQIPWGIALIIAGIALFAVSVFTTEEGTTSEKIKTFLKGLAKVVGAAALVLGIIMCCFGIITPISIGLIVLGAATLVTAIALDSKAAQNKISKVFEGIKSLAKGWGKLILGILLCCVGVFPLGIPLVKSGATYLTQSESQSFAKLREKLSDVKEKIKNGWQGWGKLILGIVLCCTGIFKLGVPLVKAGANHLLSSNDVTFAKLREKLSDVKKKIQDGWQGWGKFILGLILCCTGNFKLGIPLVKAGAKHLYESESPVFTALVDTLSDVWESIKTYWDKNIAPWFTKDKWKKLAGNIVSGLKEKFKSGINSIIGFFESMINNVIDMFNKISFTVPDWVPEIGGKKYGIDIAHVSIPRLAKGAVIPANREFLAVLGDQKQGTNIEAPAKLIKQMAMEAIAETGGISGKETIEVPIYLDSDVLYRAIVNRNQKYKKAMGVSPLGV